MFLRAKNITMASEFALKIALEMVDLHRVFPPLLHPWQKLLSREADAAPLEWREGSGKKPEDRAQLSKSAANLGLINCLFAQRTGAAA